jgi:hypothetical protein
MRDSWSLRLRGEDKKSSSTEEETRGSGVYAFVRQQIFIDGGRCESVARLTMHGSRNIPLAV